MEDSAGVRGYGKGGYQTPNTAGISFGTCHGGKMGGRTFGIDLDMFNAIHFHTSKFGVGKKSDWIKAHHSWVASFVIGIGVGISDGYSEW